MKPSSPTPPLVETARRAAADLVGWRLDRMRTALDGPLCIVGAGGSYPVASLWARLHAESGAPAWARTPLELREGRLPSGAAVLILSASGRHHDIMGAADIALARGHAVHAVTTNPDAPLVARLRDADPAHQTLVATKPAHKEGLAARHGTVPLALVAGRIYASDLSASAFETPADDLDGARLIGRAAPRDIIALGAGLARPAADAFAHLMRESGLAPARATDPREFAHGQFIAVGEHTRFAVFGARSQTWLAPFVDALPAELAPLTVIEEAKGAVGAVTLYARAIAAASAAMDAAGAHPGRGDITPWAATLYRMPVS